MVEGAVYVDGNSWVVVVLEAQFHHDPMSIAMGFNGGYSDDPLWGRGDVPVCCTFRVGKDLSCVRFGQSGGGGVMGGVSGSG